MITRLTAFLMLLFSLCGSATPAFARTLNFNLYTGIPSQKVYFVSELFMWDSQVFRMKEGPSGQYSIQLDEPWLHTLQYKFRVDHDWILDPDNPDFVPDGRGGYNSIIKTRDFREDPELFPNRSLTPWKRFQLDVEVKDGSTRPVTVLHPYSSSLSGRKTVTVYFQDGQDYLERTGVANLLANLSNDPRMPLITGVFIPPQGDRLKEYGFTEQSQNYIDFVSEVLVPKVEARFNTGGSRETRLIMGASMGGLISLQTALKHPQVFGHVASQSGSTWYDGYRIVPMLEQAKGINLNLFIETGTYEDVDMVDCNRKAYQAARKAGLQSRYEEYPSTHDWIAWRNRLGTILRHFFRR